MYKIESIFLSHAVCVCVYIYIYIYIYIYTYTYIREHNNNTISGNIVVHYGLGL